jgi:hypothetical protein
MHFLGYRFYCLFAACSIPRIMATGISDTYHRAICDRVSISISNDGSFSKPVIRWINTGITFNSFKCARICIYSNNISIGNCFRIIFSPGEIMPSYYHQFCTHSCNFTGNYDYPYRSTGTGICTAQNTHYPFRIPCPYSPSEPYAHTGGTYRNRS